MRKSLFVNQSIIATKKINFCTSKNQWNTGLLVKCQEMDGY